LFCNQLACCEELITENFSFETHSSFSYHRSVNTHVLHGIFLSILSFIYLLAGGFVAGTFGALLGLGGGVLLIPFLVIVLGIPMHQAIATSIIAVIATSSAGAAMNLERRIVNMRFGMLLEIATVAGAILGGITANTLSPNVLTKLFSGLLFFVAAIMVWRARQHNGKEIVYTDGVLPGMFVDDANGESVLYTVKKVPAAMCVSLVAGNVSGLLGVGGGIFKVPAMHILSGIPMKAATATSNFMIGVTAAASAFIYFAHGHINPFVASTAALGVLAGSMTGIHMSRKINSKVLTWVFTIALLGISIQLFLR
jgi:uncharacterized membrane protein YfcA